MGSEFSWWLHLLIAVVFIVYAGVKILFAYLGKEVIVPKTEEMTPFSVVERTPRRLVIGATIPFANEGKQCGTIMDAILRVQLPYEQYDGALVHGKVECEGTPREDDYFEAALIEKKQRINLALKLSIEGRNGHTLDDCPHGGFSHGSDLSGDGADAGALFQGTDEDDSGGDCRARRGCACTGREGAEWLN